MSPSPVVSRPGAIVLLLVAAVAAAFAACGRASSIDEATRAEPGCLWFDWSRSVTDPTEYVLVEAFRDGDAGAAHVNSDHFKAAQRDLPQALLSTPKVVSQTVDATGWSELAEITVELLRRDGLREDVYIRPSFYKSTKAIGVKVHGLEHQLYILTLPFGPSPLAPSNQTSIT